MRVSMCKKYQTLGGQSVRILALDRKGRGVYAVAGLLEDQATGDERFYNWTLEGVSELATELSKNVHDLNLVEVVSPPKEPERLWLTAEQIENARGYGTNMLKHLGFTDPTVEVYFWVNIYPGCNVQVHATKAEANLAAEPGRIACILVEREVERGEGL